MTAATSGTVSGPVTVPTDLTDGSYALTIAGTGANGVKRTVSANFTVSSSGAGHHGGRRQLDRGDAGVLESSADRSSVANLLWWAMLLLVFGRMAILLGRTPKVLPVVG